MKVLTKIEYDNVTIIITDSAPKEIVGMINNSIMRRRKYE
jgi:hypothetical protein